MAAGLRHVLVAARSRCGSFRDADPLSGFSSSVILRRGAWMEKGPALGRYRGLMSSPRVPGGVVHKLPIDLRKALIANPAALDAWNDITPLARNEFICWVENAKQEMTRERRIRRTQEELEEGQRRPCCWPGCKHRERTGRTQSAG
jgi:Bacteriocin-protection, YdeI or OmpD-Associated